MRNYKRYYLVKSRLQVTFDNGANWFDSVWQWQIGRTESECRDAQAYDEANLNPTFYRYNPVVFLGPNYWLLDGDYLMQLAFKEISGQLFGPPHWQPPPSPRKVWSNGH